LPTGVLCEIREAIDGVLVARIEPGA
jgi:hypothetical protein